MSKPIKMGGSSNHTIRKQELLSIVIQEFCNVMRGISIKYKKTHKIYWIDSYSGNGYYDDFKCDGSPVIFKKTMLKNGFDYNGFCIDKSEKYISELKNRLLDDKIQCISGDNETVITDVLKKIPYNGYGILYLDPNGMPNWNIVNSLKHHNIDILLHFPATSIKRNIGAKNIILDLKQELELINKKTWYICPCHHINSDAWQWCMLFGSNYNGWHGLKKEQFYDISTSKGESILNVFNHTKGVSYSDLKLPQMPLDLFI